MKAILEQLRKIGGDDLVSAVLEAIGGSQQTVEEALREGVEMKGVAVPTELAQSEPAQPEAAQSEPTTEPTADPSGQQQEVTLEPAHDEEAEASQKSARSFSSRIAQLAERAPERDREFLSALAIVVRRAEPDHFGVLAALLRTVKSKSIQDEVSELAEKMEAESGIGYAYPKPEEKGSVADEIARLAQEIEQLKQALEQRRAVPVSQPAPYTSVTRLPAAHLLFSAVRRS